ncbi:MAG: hypothetical protein IMZ54_09120 [Acidobacteria bacterium]|nr:hypothetical protein [Acidobacteriota bacterium]
MEIVEQLRERLSRELSRLPSQFRLMLLSIGVGIVAGLGAILFDRLLGWTLHAVLETFTGYAEPQMIRTCFGMSRRRGRRFWGNLRSMGLVIEWRHAQTAAIGCPGYPASRDGAGYRDAG